MMIALTLTIAGSAKAMAGAHYVAAYCSKAADGSGYCYGTFESFRNSSDPSAYIAFTQYATGTRIFQAQYANVYMSCTPDAPSSSIWPILMANQGYFLVYWNAAGTCNNVSTNSGSLYGTNF
jgi:hypothetical protein